MKLSLFLFVSISCIVVELEIRGEEKREDGAWREKQRNAIELKNEYYVKDENDVEIVEGEGRRPHLEPFQREEIGGRFGERRVYVGYEQRGADWEEGRGIMAGGANFDERSGEMEEGFGHEPPVLAGNVSILHSEPDVITVCKPASIPDSRRSDANGTESARFSAEFMGFQSEVHPCGQYRKNTIVGILQAEHGVAPLFPIHRLDRLVSGLLIFARNAGKAEQFRQQVTRPYCYYKSDDVI
ncbi:RNA pseudouridine synthase 7 [Dendrobium catenatum]|uniref:RNA pseudouridine synthase 7 n=1 Tax=Dendrobium catenatum TaxID=906689 RepID=A0A2I0WR36_9ASPA|nr:RNA pseudouridine synthase 7 [Dendrobium catenatum]